MSHFRISDFTDDSKPREKLLANGAEYLSDAELLAILLGSGTKEMNVVELASTILRENGGLVGLRKLSKQELTEIKGVGPAKASGILGAIELGRRFSKVISNSERPKLNSAQDVYDFMHYEMAHLAHEELRVLSLDTKHFLISSDLLYRGTINTSTIRIAEIFRKPLLLNAAAFILVHNHPSGDSTPSAADIVTTRKIIEMGNIMDLPLVDHIIIGAGTFSSIKSFIN